MAMAKAFKAGDIRTGYYRDQTFMLATGMTTLDAFFAQLYAHPSLEHEPASGGRSMNGHFATRWLNSAGEFMDLTQGPQSTADISPTGGQMGRGLGIAFASKWYRQHTEQASQSPFSVNGNEISFVTIGNASTSEGHFWETINAAGVLQVPLVISVWDDDYGISVHAKYQTTKENISEILKGFHPHFQTYKLKNRLLKEGLIKNICAICDLSTWNNKQINLELDHIDGNRVNHEFNNLRLLCPNCHSQTDTYRSKNRKSL